ncbi:ATP-dependent DNA ligase clustered with Ku protein, LigD [Cupriavidus sp. U2]|uniref:DNA ligase D n=1 Tax=Cupriavidus sp. U2 TaxID=2920269 RepID=UPI00129D82FA|nr:DNA ligase D [Cupriavidus sp. U2]KAI3591871.1 ATP-dependent DNA ligase clustered with Ku protein, LigD [Cupriavidus sp. U2]
MAKSAAASASTDAPLGKYQRKRDFAATPEPSGKQAPRTAKASKGKAAAGNGAHAFVIQKHAARRLHYDFRLELDGTLKSWAVPKGPSYDPADKRMAVHVEDHPLDYADFEGVIPAGHYGAGTVIVWDRGEWIPDTDPEAGYRDGKLKFELRGEKLQGHWTLVRMGGKKARDDNAWLLIKERDEYARPASEFDVVEAMPDSVLAGTAKAPTKKAARGKDKPASNKTSKTGSQGGKAESKMPALPAGAKKAALPLALAPQLATLVDKPPADPSQWQYEIKFDGYRIVARIDGADVRLFTRNGNDWTSKLRALAAEIAALGWPDGWLDGEIVVVDKDGITDFQALQNAFETAHAESIQFYVFDLPWFAGHDLRAVPLAERRALLRELLASHTPGRVRFSDNFEGAPADMLDAACRMKLEGIIGKRVDAPYVSSRAPSWIKLKCQNRQEFVIGGYTDPKGSRSGLGSLLLGVHDADGKLRYVGNVGTGFDTAMLDALRKQLEPLRTDDTPFDPLPRGIKGHWIKPRLVAEVTFGAWTREGRIRHSVFHALRTDKPAASVTLEVPAKADAPGRTPSGKTAMKVATKTAAKAAVSAATKTTTSAPSRKGTKAAIGNVVVSHADRVIDKSTGLTKGDLVGYYAQASDLMLPFLRGRPLALVRAPSGIDGEQFFQRHGDTLHLKGVNALDPELWPGHPPLLEITSAAAIVEAAQLNVVEFHTWNARARNIDKPDQIVFDIDPGEGVSWREIQEAASLVKALLDALSLQSFLKTSGGKGLHVVVPLAARAGWDAVRDFAQDAVTHMARTIPERFVSKSGPRNRVGKIFIDYLRNGVGATTAAAFSARARPGLGVSIPVSWDELDDLTGAAQWTIANVASRLDELARHDPWAGHDKVRQTLTQARRQLDAA